MWSKLREEATSLASRERILSKILTELILERESLSDALSWRSEFLVATCCKILSSVCLSPVELLVNKDLSGRVCSVISSSFQALLRINAQLRLVLISVPDMGYFGGSFHLWEIIVHANLE